jgi:spore maturation protein CgeB
MRVVMFYHSLRSDWNHGNAHFLRGVARELQRRGHTVVVYEPVNGWSASNLAADHGPQALEAYRDAYPSLEGGLYNATSLDLDVAVGDADLVIVHEWNDHELVRRIGEHRAATGGYALLFHDTHHRAVTDAAAMAAYDLRHYDGVLAYGRTLRDLYLERGWTERAWTWHEAADVEHFRPRQVANERDGDVVWIGNWGDDERAAELDEFLLDPVRKLGLRARVHGVRYPEHARRALENAGVEYAGWLPNYRAPDVFARYAFTVHVPRRPYSQALPGIPTIRVFEALACGIPLISAPWDDVEGLFEPGRDYLVARNGSEMMSCMRTLLNDRDCAQEIVSRGLHAIRSRHTCAHRVDELLGIAARLTPWSARRAQFA